MSGFAVIFDRSNRPIDPRDFERVMQRLSHRGPDGRDQHLAGNLVLGHWHFWTTPEEVGERQPVSLPGQPYTLVFDGRLDNRPELLMALGLSPAEEPALSDACLALHAYARWGAACCEHFLGEFALVIHDPQRAELLCARDQLGDRTLFYSIIGSRVVIASEPWAVAGGGKTPAEVNDIFLAANFAFQVPADGQTLFKDIYEILPAHMLTINASAHTLRRYWQPYFSTKLRGLSDQEYADRFRALLDQSVACRMRATTPVGILMSGGLDSPSVAGLAARQIAPQQLTTLSYVFDELTECDERKDINAVVEKWHLHSIQISGDEDWTYKEMQYWPENPNKPESDPYRLLHERIFERAHAEGLRVLLDGSFGDNLYSAGNYWWADLISDGKLLTAVKELRDYVHYCGWKVTWQIGFIQRAVGHFLNLIPGGRYLHLAEALPEWLTDYAVRCISKIAVAPDRLHERYNSLIGMNVSRDVSASDFYFNRHSLEIRHPYRDRRLIEFALALPAYQLFKRGLYKHILRNAMRGILPESIRTSHVSTSYMPLFFRGIEREKKLFQESIQTTNAIWQKFVKVDWVFEHCFGLFTSDNQPPNVLIPWLCITRQNWYELFSHRYGGSNE